MRTRLKDLLYWLGKRPIMLSVGQFLLALLLYFIYSTLVNPRELISDPWGKFSLFLFVNLPIAVGLGWYVWYKNKTV